MAFLAPQQQLVTAAREPTVAVRCGRSVVVHASSLLGIRNDKYRAQRGCVCSTYLHAAAACQSLDCGNRGDAVRAKCG
jgi:hypothetical protein